MVISIEKIYIHQKDFIEFSFLDVLVSKGGLIQHPCNSY